MQSRKLIGFLLNGNFCLASYLTVIFFVVFSLIKGRPVYIGLAVDLSDYEINMDPLSIKSLNLSIPRNPKDEHQAALENVIDLVKKVENIVVIVDV